MIDPSEVKAASSALTAALDEHRLVWIIDAVNQKESEISATADLLRARTARRKELIDAAEAKNKKPPKEDPLPFELNDWDFVDEHYRRLLLLIVAIDQYCVGPFNAARVAEMTVRGRLDAPTNLMTEILQPPPPEAVAKLQRTVRELADFLGQNSGDERVVKILAQWHGGR